MKEVVIKIYKIKRNHSDALCKKCNSFSTGQAYSLSQSRGLAPATK
ncbi:hypothetical protein [Campylobacter fetus]|nr:hypothetical protein [Campylobacter fetus]